MAAACRWPGPGSSRSFWPSCAPAGSARGHWGLRRPGGPGLGPGLAGLAIVVVALAWAFHQTRSSGGSAYGGEARFVAGGFTLKGFANYVWQFYLPSLPGMAPKIGPDYGFQQVFIYSFFGAFGSLETAF